MSDDGRRRHRKQLYTVPGLHAGLSGPQRLPDAISQRAVAQSDLLSILVQIRGIDNEKNDDQSRC
jgi:hypothetical protein